MHAALKVGGGSILASDSFGSRVQEGQNFSITLNFESENELNEAWEKLGEGGTVTMPLENAFWGARFGMMRDRFGINWMFNGEMKQKA